MNESKPQRNQDIPQKPPECWPEGSKSITTLLPLTGHLEAFFGANQAFFLSQEIRLIQRLFFCRKPLFSGHYWRMGRDWRFAMSSLRSSVRTSFSSPPHSPYCFTTFAMADGEGFEPPEPLPAQRFSRPPQSTTLPPIRVSLFRVECRKVGSCQAPSIMP